MNAKPMLYQKFAVLGLSMLIVVMACNAPIGGEATPTPTLTATQVVGEQGTATPTAPGAATNTPPSGATATSAPGVTPSATTCALSWEYVSDVTVPDGTQITAGTAFTKTWRVRNDGCAAWPAGIVLVFVSGNQMGGPISVSVPATAVGGTQDISVNLTAPSTPGDYTGRWGLRTPDGTLLDGVVTVVITSVAPTATIVPTATPTATPTTTSVGFTAGYAGTWMCGTLGRVSFRIQNTGTTALESMSIRVEGPVGTTLNNGNQDAPFRPVPPQPEPACVQAGAESLAVAGVQWVALPLNPLPAGGTGGRAVIQMCSANGLGGACSTVTVDFTF